VQGAQEQQQQQQQAQAQAQQQQQALQAGRLLRTLCGNTLRFSMSVRLGSGISLFLLSGWMTLRAG
jgi:hypothetical protein